MEIATTQFIRKFAELITFEEFKVHILSYIDYKSSEDLISAIEKEVHDYLFVSTAPWYRRTAHQMISEIIYLLARYYVKHNELPFSAQQALADGASDYMDVHIIEKVLSVARTWE